MHDIDQEEFLRTTQLVQQAQKGDDVAANTLMSRFLPRVRKIVVGKIGRRVRQLDEVEDVLQGAMLKAWKDLGTYKATTEGSFMCWMAKVGFNAVVSDARFRNAQMRDPGREQTVLGPGDETGICEPEGNQSTPSEWAIGNELKAQIDEAVYELEPKHREAYLLSVIGGASAKEVAGAMGLQSEAYARVVVHRALRRLAEIVASWESSDE